MFFVRRKIKNHRFLILILILIILYKLYNICHRPQIFANHNDKVYLDDKINLKYSEVSMYQKQLNYSCNLVELNEWDPKIKNLLKATPRYKKCAENEPLTYIENDALYINQTINQTVFKGKVYKCEVAPIKRNVSEKDSYALDAYTEFSNSFSISLYEFVTVRCFTNDPIISLKFKLLKNQRKRLNVKFVIKNKVNYLVVYEYVHFNFFKTQNAFDNEKLNVMILILDGVSLSSMKRALPKTLNYLKTLKNYFLFQKHHVVGENTFQNLVPLLTNLNIDQINQRKEVLKNKTHGKLEPPFDDLPFIWNDFKQRSYITYFSEEWKQSTFYNLKFGFKKSPTTHYLRPYWLALYESLSYEPTSLNSNPKPCYYNKLLHKMSFDWLESFEKFYGNFTSNIPRFGIVKVNEMSHDYLERLFWIDDDLLKLVKNLLTPAFLNNTLFILMGDHGHRFHIIRQTFIGKIEEKLPLFSMLIPNKVVKNKKNIMENMVQNTKRLTTWFDVYETLLHLLDDQTNIGDYKITSRYLTSLNAQRKFVNKPKGYSLFMPIPNRNCHLANIPEYLCSCDLSLNIDPKNHLIQNSAKFMIKYINNVLLKDHHNICMPLNLSNAIDAQYSRNQNKYSIIFKALPSKAVFDGTVQINTISSNEYKYKIVGNIVRINSYGSTSKCIKDYFLRNYCYCYELK